MTNIYNIEKYHPVSPDALSEDGNYFIINCPDDDLLESGFGPKDMLYINTSAEVKSGDVVLVFYEARSMMRFYYPESDGTITLKADSSIIEKENFTPEEIRIVGRIDGRYTKF